MSEPNSIIPAGNVVAEHWTARFSRPVIFVILALITVGVYLAFTIPVAVFPNTDFPKIIVAIDNGVSPIDQMEVTVTRPIEEAMNSVPGLDRVISTTSRGSGEVSLFFNWNVDMFQTLEYVNAALARVQPSLPPTAKLTANRMTFAALMPILAYSLTSDTMSQSDLWELANYNIKPRLNRVNGVSTVVLQGGSVPEFQIEPDPAKLLEAQVTVPGILDAVSKSNMIDSPGLIENNHELSLTLVSGQARNPAEIANIVVRTTPAGLPVRIGDIATVHASVMPVYTMVAADGKPAVLLNIFRQADSNTVAVADAASQELDQIQKTLPPGVKVQAFYDQSTLVHDSIASVRDAILIGLILAAIILVLFLRDWGSSLVAALVIPATIAITLIALRALGETLNLMTLGGLAAAVGLVIDDAIVVVENIVRHFRLPGNRNRSASTVTVEAVAEVGNPTILATFAVIAAVLPMAFVRGLMGPYMRPIPVGASAAMLFSLMVAFVVSPWAALRLLGKHLGGAHLLEPGHENWRTRLYRKVMSPLIASGRNRLLFFAAVLALLLISTALVPLGLVRVKMLPFDNKSELQVIINMPDGTPLEQTLAVSQALGNELGRQRDVLNYQLYAGTSGPYNFNGLVRHYYMRRLPNQADIQVNLVPAGRRHDQSHAIATRLRPILVDIGNQFGARIQVSEVPPGPPVIQTLVAEVYGPNLDGQTKVAQQIKSIFQHTPGVVDTDWYVEDLQPRLSIHVDAVKAAQNGIAVADVANALAVATSGVQAGLLHDEQTREPIPAVVQFTREHRSSEQALQNIHLPGANGAMVPLRELITLDRGSIQQSIYHKNLRRVVYVTGDVAGAEESPIYAILKMNKELDQLKLPAGYTLTRYNAAMPESTDHYSMKWDGEWHITIEVFRDLGLAFAAVLILIYVLVVGWFRSFLVPLIIMAPIPLTLIGILPAHALMGAFFTATSMIGFIAGAGIIVRNSIILVDFIELRRRHGAPLAEAVIDAGAIRFRPMLLTAAAVVVGASVILTDPIFQGLAVSLIAGAVASTFLSWPTIPILYYLVHLKSETPVTCAPETHEFQGVAQ
jgi:multidrug efflux pump subunit AcrB